MIDLKSSVVACLTGHNNAGKSSILQAVEMAFTGECDRYRKRNSNQAEIIHGKEHRYEITVETDRGIVRRGRSSEAPFLYWNDSSGKPSEVEPVMMRDLGCSKEMISALLNTGDFLNMEAAKQREILMAVTGVKVNDAMIASLFEGDKEALKMIDSVNSIADLERLYKKFYDERTHIKRRLNDLKPMPPREGEAPDLVDIKGKLDKYEHQEKELIGKIAGLKASNPQTEISSLESQISVVKAALDGIDAMKLKKETDTTMAAAKVAQTRIANAKKDLEIFGQKLMECNATEKVNQRNYNLLHKFTKGGKCVAGEHLCPADLGVMQTAAAQSKAAFEAASQEKARLQQEIDRLKGLVSDDSDLKQCENTMLKLSRQDAIYRSKTQELAELNNKLEQVKQAPKTEIEKLIGDEEALLSQTRLRIAKGKKILESAQDYVSYQNQVAGVAKERADLERELVLVEQLVEFFGPTSDGVKKRLVNDKIVTLQDEVNRYLKPLGFVVYFKEEGLEVMNHEHGMVRPIGRLSGSERFRLGVAIQVALAKFTNFNMIIVDNAEILYPEIRKNLILTLLRSGLHQAFIALTVMVPLKDFKPPKAAGLEWFGIVNQEGVSAVAPL